MRKPPLFLLAILVLLIGLVVFLSTQAREVPVAPIETEVVRNGSAQ